LRTKVIVSGAGSAALACANLYVQLGVNITMFDKDGVLSVRTDLSLIQNDTQLKRVDISRGYKGDDFLGLSAGNVLSADVAIMANNPIVLQWQIQFHK
jgi:malate dehydrogenase (oxaloacetate-decarboxylating)(NADP+)